MEGKAVPRTLRNLPHKDANGKIDLPHQRNAMTHVTHTNLSKDQQKQAHDVLLRAYKQVGMPYSARSVPGCKGYELSKKKSMLGYVVAFRAYRESLPRGRQQMRCRGSIGKRMQGQPPAPRTAKSGERGESQTASL
jgi:hypothetical protein